MPHHLTAEQHWRQASRPFKHSVPLVHRQRLWLDTGQAGWCWLLGLVIACEIGVIAWQLLAR